MYWYNLLKNTMDNNNEYTDLETIKFELDITGDRAEKLLYDFRKKMKSTGCDLMSCIKNYKVEIEKRKGKKKLQNGFSKTFVLLYKLGLLSVFGILIFTSLKGTDALAKLEGQGPMIAGLLLLGMIVGAIVSSFWESDHSIFVNGLLGTIGSIIGFSWTSHAFSDMAHIPWFYYLLSVLIAVTIFLFLFNLIISFGGLLLTCIIALGFGVSNLAYLEVVFSDWVLLCSVGIISLLFGFIHHKLTNNYYRRFVYLFLTSLIGGVFGVVVISNSLDFSNDLLKGSISSLMGSVIVVLFTEFIDKQADNI